MFKYLSVVMVLGLAASLNAQPVRPRLLVLTDIGGDPDDQQSMRRLMLYSHAFRIVGLVASASGTPGELDETRVQPQLIRDIVDDYGAVHTNLLLHNPDYPKPDNLYAVIKSGSPQRGVAFIGRDRASDGSNHLIAAVDAATSDDPVYVTIWGGAHDLAQALFDVRADRSPDELQAFLSRLRVYAIGDQDGYNTVIDGQRQDGAGTGAWIKENFPTLRYVEANPPEINRFAALFRGMYQNDSKGGDYPVVPLVDDETALLNQEAWVEANIRIDHGPLGAGYPLVNQNPGSERNTRGVKEGDTPSWFFVLPNGLSNPEEPTWGGWGGRFEHHADNHFIDTEDHHPSGLENAGLGHKWTVARWRRAYQNDFAAGMDWCVQSYEASNHHPKVALNGDSTMTILRHRLGPGQRLLFDAHTSSDPDGDDLTFRWWMYEEPSSYDNTVQIDAMDSSIAFVRYRKEASGHTLHLILEVTDSGAPALTAYRRVLIEVE